MPDDSPLPPNPPPDDPATERIAQRVAAILAERTSQPPLPLQNAPMNGQTGSRFGEAARWVRTLVPIAGIAQPATPGPQPGFSIGQFLRDLRLIGQMYFDPRYRLSPAAQIGVPVLAVLAVMNYLFWGYLLPIPVLAFFGERIILCGLAIALCLVLMRETQRYRTVLDYLAKYG